MTGRKPKPEGQRRNRVASPHEWTEVPNEPYTGPHPELFKKRRIILQFGNVKDVVPHQLTKAWWADICSMPHCCLWSTSDWRYAVATALVADAFHYGHSPSASELARREKVLGVTADARRDLRIRYVDAAVEEPPAGVTSLTEYRNALE